ncbi:MAG: glutathione S-transferase family protein [Methylobacteriaceae bacterium]|nr:glutathione S-transferase family protein [Methylobacteriaceae bacterium]
MGTLKIYGTIRSRANRVIWMAEELGIPYESISVDLAAPRDPAFLKVNPNGRLPAIDDDGFYLFESMAINLYLAKKHGGALAPRNAHEDAKMIQWSFWAVTELEKAGLDYLMHTMFLPAEKRDASIPPKALETLKRPIAVLEQALGSSAYLVGDRFTVADLNVGCFVAYLASARDFLSQYPNVGKFVAAIAARPAFKKAMPPRG